MSHDIIFNQDYHSWVHCSCGQTTSVMHPGLLPSECSSCKKDFTALELKQLSSVAECDCLFGDDFEIGMGRHLKCGRPLKDFARLQEIILIRNKQIEAAKGQTGWAGHWADKQFIRCSECQRQGESGMCFYCHQIFGQYFVDRSMDETKKAAEAIAKIIEEDQDVKMDAIKNEGNKDIPLTIAHWKGSDFLRCDHCQELPWNKKMCVHCIEVFQSGPPNFEELPDKEIQHAQAPKKLDSVDRRLVGAFERHRTMNDRRKTLTIALEELVLKTARFIVSNTEDLNSKQQALAALQNFRGLALQGFMLDEVSPMQFGEPMIGFTKSEIRIRKKRMSRRVHAKRAARKAKRA